MSRMISEFCKNLLNRNVHIYENKYIKLLRTYDLQLGLKNQKGIYNTNIDARLLCSYPHSHLPFSHLPH